MKPKIFLFFVFIGLALIFPVSAFAQGNSDVHNAIKKLKERIGDKVKVEWRDSRVNLEGKLSLPYPGTPEDAAKEFLKENAAIFQTDPALSDMEIESMNEDKIGDKHLGYYVRFKQTYRGLPIFEGGGVGVTLNPDKSISMVSSSYLPNINISTTPTLSEKEVIEIAKSDYIKNCSYYPDKTWKPQSCAGMAIIFKDNSYVKLGVFEHKGKPYLIYKVLLDVEFPPASLEYIVDANNGIMLEGGGRNLIKYFSGTGKVFDPNPVNTLNNTGLRDATGGSPDADAPDFNGAYFTKILMDITFNLNRYFLIGPYVDITDSIERPFYFKKSSGYVLSTSGNFNFTRSPDEFEHVMVYYHIDTNQRYIQSLGFTNVNNRRIKIDPHGLNGADNSHYKVSSPNYPPGAGYLAFGEGGVDDAEDADVILHEYGHAIQDNVAPGKYDSGICNPLNSCNNCQFPEAAAMGEGFGDYWAASNTYGSTFDPACIGEWDAVPNCLRRVDSTKQYPQTIVNECHADGEIWSGALWDMFKSPLLGKTITDTLILRSHSIIGANNLIQNPTFCDGAKAILQADQQLYAGIHKDTITNVMANRGIFGPFNRVGSIALSSGEDYLTSAVIDTVNGYAYFGTDTFPGQIIKIRLSDFSIVGVLTLLAGEDQLHTAVIDTANGFAYFGTLTMPGKIVKIRLSDFTRVGSITLNIGEDYLSSAIIDTTNGYAYFGTFTLPGKIVKISLASFTQVGILTLSSDEQGATVAVMDTINDYAYFGTGNYPSKIIKIRLSDFVRTSTLTLDPGEDVLKSAVIDTTNGFAYFGTSTIPGIIIKVRLFDFTKVGTIILNTGEDSLYTAVIDTLNGYAYFGTDIGPGTIIKIRLSDFTRNGTLTLYPGEDGLESAVIDTTKGFAYFGTSTMPGRVIKIRVPCGD